MKNLNSELTKCIFSEFTLSNEEMIFVRGGGGDPDSIPTPPPVKI